MYYDPATQTILVTMSVEGTWLLGLVLFLVVYVSWRGALQTNAGLFAKAPIRALWRSRWLRYVYPGANARCVLIWASLFTFMSLFCHYDLQLFSGDLAFLTFPIFCAVPLMLVMLPINSVMSYLVSLMKSHSIALRTLLLTLVPVIVLLGMDLAFIGPFALKVMKARYGENAPLSLALLSFISALFPIIQWGLIMRDSLKREDLSQPKPEALPPAAPHITPEITPESEGAE